MSPVTVSCSSKGSNGAGSPPVSSGDTLIIIVLLSGVPSQVNQAHPNGSQHSIRMEDIPPVRSGGLRIAHTGERMAYGSAPGQMGLTQQSLQYLPVLIAWELLDDLPGVGDLVGGQPVPDVLGQYLGLDRVAKLHHRLQSLSVPFVRDAEDGTIDHRGVL